MITVRRTIACEVVVTVISYVEKRDKETSKPSATNTPALLVL